MQFPTSMIAKTWMSMSWVRKQIAELPNRVRQMSWAWRPFQIRNMIFSRRKDRLEFWGSKCRAAFDISTFLSSFVFSKRIQSHACGRLRASLCGLSSSHIFRLPFLSASVQWTWYLRCSEQNPATPAASLIFLWDEAIKNSIKKPRIQCSRFQSAKFWGDV